MPEEKDGQYEEAKEFDVDPLSLTPEEKAEIDEARRLDAAEAGEKTPLPSEAETKPPEATPDKEPEPAADIEELTLEAMTDEKNPHHKLATRVVELLTQGDPLRDESHPFHKLVSDNQAEARRAQNESADLRRSLEEKDNQIRTLVGRVPQGAEPASKAAGAIDEKTVYGGVSLEDAMDNNRLGDWINGLLKTELDSRFEKRDSEAQFESERRDFLKSHPEFTKDRQKFDDFERRWMSGGISHEQCFILDQVEQGGGVQALIDNAKATAKKEALTEFTAAAQGNAGKTKPLTGDDGVTKTPEESGFKLLSAEEFEALPTEKAQEEYAKAIEAEVKAGRLDEEYLKQVSV